MSKSYILEKETICSRKEILWEKLENIVKNQENY